jgi:hypothetical protein
MKLAIQDESASITVEVAEATLTVSQVIERLFRPAMLGMLYQEESVTNALGEVDDNAFS